MNDFIKKFEGMRNLSILRVLLLAVAGIIMLTLVIWLISFALRSAFTGVNMLRTESSVTYPAYAVPGGVSYDSYGGGVTKLSVRNTTMPPMPGNNYVIGTDAEAFEVRDYNGTFETSNLGKVCGELEALKVYDYVVFEIANKGDNFCNYVFKVKNEEADGIRVMIEDLGPKTFVANTETIKKTLDDFTSQQEILEKKLISIEQTLIEAQRSYDELRVLATQSRDAEALAKVIESKINLIERLTNERLDLNSQLDFLAQGRALQLDRLEYTHFQLYVYERLIVDFKEIKDSWKTELKTFTFEFNQVLQGVTVELMTFGLRVVQGALYFVLALLIVKYGWRFTKKLWRI